MPNFGHILFELERSFSHFILFPKKVTTAVLVTRMLSQYTQLVLVSFLNDRVSSLFSYHTAHFDCPTFLLPGLAFFKSFLPSLVISQSEFAKLSLPVGVSKVEVFN